MKENDLENFQVYELGYHILPTVPEDKVRDTVSKLENLIIKNGGAVITQEFPRVRALAYEIKKRVETKYLRFNKAYFGWIKFEAEPSIIGEIKNGAAAMEEILRFIIVKTVRENIMQGFKPMISKENGREEPKPFNMLDQKAEKQEVSEEEIDKSIDELVTNQEL